jgi:hypothetical protein
MTLEMQAVYFDMKSKLNFCLVHIYIILAQLKVCAHLYYFCSTKGLRNKNRVDPVIFKNEIQASVHMRSISITPPVTVVIISRECSKFLLNVSLSQRSKGVNTRFHRQHILI